MPRPAPVLCQVVGCTAPLASLRTYFLKQRICEEHARADAVPDGQGGWCRFCQQCTKLEPLHAFEGKKHSCRASLLKRHHRHRQQRGRAGGSSAQQRSSSSSEGQLPEPSNSSMQRGSPLPMAMEHIAVQELPRGALAATIAALPDAAAGPQAPYHQAGDAAGPGASLATLLACQAAGAASQGAHLPTSGPAGDLAGLPTAAGGGPATTPSPPAQLPALALPAGATSQPGLLWGQLEQLCADSAAATAAVIKAAATGNALLGTLCSSSGGGNSARELLLGQLVLQDLQLLQRMLDNVLLQLRTVQAARSVAALAAARLPPPQQQQQLPALPVSAGPAPSITLTSLDGEALAQLLLLLQCATQAHSQPPAPPLLVGKPGVEPWAARLPPAQQQQQQQQQQQPAVVVTTAGPSSGSGGLQLQQMLAALQQPPGGTAASGGSGSSSWHQQPAGVARGSSPSLEAQLQVALVQLRNAGQDAAGEPPSLYSAGTAGGTGGPVSGCSPTSASKLVQGAGLAAVQPGDTRKA